MNNSVSVICVKTIEWSLIAIIAIVPLIINPGAFDFWYRPKIESVYALLFIASTAWMLLLLADGRSFLWERNPLTQSPFMLCICCYSFHDLFNSLFPEP